MRTTYLPAWSLGADCYDKVYEIVRPYGKKVAVIGGKTALSVAVPRLNAVLKGTDLELTEPIWYGGDATYENVEMLSKLKEVQEADMVFGVGGGRAVDTSKCLCDKLGKPYFTFPTLASNCAACTALCIMYNADGTVNGNYYPKRCPNHTFINTAIVAEAPSEYLWAGIGDALSKEFETEFGARKDIADGTVLTTPLMGVSVSPSATKTLMKYGAKAMEQVKAHQSGFELDQVTLAIVITTGIASNLCVGGNLTPPYYYNSSIAHAFYYGCTVCEGADKHLHGELVALGILVLLTLDGRTEERDGLIRFYKTIRLPVTIAEAELTETDLPKLTDKAESMMDWRIAPYEISKEQFIKAILETDAAGRAV